MYVKEVTKYSICYFFFNDLEVIAFETSSVYPCNCFVNINDMAETKLRYSNLRKRFLPSSGHHHVVPNHTFYPRLQATRAYMICFKIRLYH